MFLAQAQGWLNDSNLELLTTQSATESLAALSTGQVDGAALTLDEVLLARAYGIPLTIVLVFDISAGADMVLARPTISDLTALKGKRIGVETTALGSLMLHKLLEAANLTQNEISVVSLNIDKQLQAWQNDQIDVLVTYEPVAEKIRSTGAKLIFDSRQIPDTIFDVLAIRSERISQHEQTINALILAHFRTLNYFRHNSLDAAYRMARRMKLTGPDALKTFRGLELPSIHANRRYLSDGQSSRLKYAAKTLTEIMFRQKMVAQTDTLERLFTDLYLPRDQ